MTKTGRLLHISTISLAIVFFSGCGGGGSGASSNGGANGNSNGGGNSASPIASSGVITTNEDTSGNGILSALDPENDAITFSIVTNSSKGNIVINNPATGSFTYTPNANENGSDNFTFKANDGSSDSNTATIAITILSINDNPIAQSNTIATPEDSPTTNTLVATDAESQPLTYSIVSNGSKGTAQITNTFTGAFNYFPFPDTNGVDSFTFQANDGFGNSNTATITINVAPINDAPVSQAGSLTTNEDTNGSGTLVAIDAELQLLTYSIIGNPGQGSISLDNSLTGDYTYTPAPDSNGTDSFTFLANDGSTNSAIGTITVTINAVNDPPVATGSCNTVRQAQSLNATLGATDIETPTLLTYSLSTDGSGGSGPLVTANGGTVTITNQTTGAFTYQPNTSAGDHRGTDSFSYRVSDASNATDNAVENLVVNQTIMPLGDSITAGRVSLAAGPPIDLRVGYRQHLHNALLADGYTFDLVGNVVHGNNVPNFDFNHEGHGGFNVSDIVFGENADGFPIDGVRAWLDDNPADVVLLHIGTNGVDPNADLDVENLLDEIDDWEASATGNPVTVILGLIVDRSPNDPDVTAFNNNVQTMANARIASGDNIIIVDHQNAIIYPDDMGDDTHPNDSGYAKIAGVWLTPLEPLLDKCN